MKLLDVILRQTKAPLHGMLGLLVPCNSFLEEDVEGKWAQKATTQSQKIKVQWITTSVSGNS